MTIEQIAQQIVDRRHYYTRVRDIAAQIVASREVPTPTPIDVTVNVPKQVIPDQLSPEE